MACRRSAVRSRLAPPPSPSSAWRHRRKLPLCDNWITSEVALSRRRVLFCKGRASLRSQPQNRQFNQKIKPGNTPTIDSNNAGSWQVLARFFDKRVTICAAADGAGRAMLAGGIEGVANE